MQAENASNWRIEKRQPSKKRWGSNQDQLKNIKTSSLTTTFKEKDQGSDQELKKEKNKIYIQKLTMTKKKSGRENETRV